MRNYVSILFVVGLLCCITPTPCMAQDEITQYVSEELKNFYKDLEKMGRRIDTAKNVEVYETEFKARHQIVESWYGINSEVIFSDKELMSKYIRYTSLHEAIQKTIEEKKAEKAKQEKLRKLTGKLNGFMQELAALEEAGNRHVANKRIDSLKMAKDKANDCISRATMEYGKSQELIDDDDDLYELWMSLKETGTRISNMQVVKKNWFDPKKILVIVGIIAAITLIVTMVSSLVKSAKMAKMSKVKKVKKVKKPKKKEEDLPSI